MNFGRELKKNALSFVPDSSHVVQSTHAVVAAHRTSTKTGWKEGIQLRYNETGQLGPCKGLFQGLPKNQNVFIIADSPGYSCNNSNHNSKRIFKYN